jgi:hypothetical protein
MARARFAVVTTCNASGWEQYGRRMVETFDRFWPASIPLYLYAEGFTPDHPRPLVREMPAWLGEFKARHADHSRARGLVNGNYNYLYDCVRFAHKVAAVTDAGLRTPADVLIWADADIITHSSLDEAWLNEIFPPGPYIAWLDRSSRFLHPECGFYMLRCSHPAHLHLMTRFRELYETDAVLALAETDDSSVLQHLIVKAERDGLATTHSLSGDAWDNGHPLINGPLGARLDHLKGPRKESGRSPVSDLMKPRAEEYWQGTSGPHP